MATGIPLPGDMSDTFRKGVDTGSNMFTRMMQPILERERQKQLESHFQEQLKLQKAAAGRAGANSDLRRQMMQEQLLGLKHKNDPMYDLNQFAALQKMLMGSGQQQEAPQIPAPTQEMGEGMGMFTPEGMRQEQEPQQHPSQMGGQGGGQMGGINLEALKNNPLLRGFFKHKFGIDPLAPSAQTLEDKQSMALDLFRQKEKVKQDAKTGDIATNKVLTQNQLALQAIDTVIPMLDEFIKNPDKVYGQFDFSPSKKAAYEAKTGGMIDMLVAAQALPQVKESVELVKDQVRRRANETTKAYIERIKDFKKDLSARRSKSKSVVQSKKVDTERGGDDFSQMSDDELLKIAGGG